MRLPVISTGRFDSLISMSLDAAFSKHAQEHIGEPYISKSDPCLTPANIGFSLKSTEK